MCDKSRLLSVLYVSISVYDQLEIHLCDAQSRPAMNELSWNYSASYASMGAAEHLANV